MQAVQKDSRQGAAPPPGGIAWLVLTYRLPANPSLKIAVRRRLTALGAVYPANAVAALPASAAAERACHRLRGMIGEVGGSAQVLRTEAIEGGQGLVAAFNAAREREYEKVIANCADMLADIEEMTAAAHFRYADLGEKDAELRRLSMRNEAIRGRDALGAANAGSAMSSLAKCRTAIDDFARRVYQTDAVTITGTRRR